MNGERLKSWNFFQILVGLLVAIAMFSPLAVLAEETPPADPNMLIFNEAANHLQHKDFRSASKLYRKAIVDQPDSPYGYLGLGMSQQAQGRLEDSQQTLERLITLHPDFAPGYYNLGMVLEAKGDLMSAKSQYKKYVDLSHGQLPADPELHIKLRKMGLK